MIETFVEFEHYDGESDGYLGCDSRVTIERVVERNIDTIKVLDTVDSFRFFDAEVKGSKIVGEPINYSPRYFYHGHLVNKNQVSHGDILFRMMNTERDRLVTQAVRKRHGGYCEFSTGDVLIPDPDDQRDSKKLRFDEHSGLGPLRNGKTVITEIL